MVVGPVPVDPQHVQEDIAELRSIIEQTKSRTLRGVFAAHLEELLKQEQQQRTKEQSSSSEQQSPSQVPFVEANKAAENRGSLSSQTTKYKEPSFGWEDEGWGKEKVQIYLLSGFDGVGDLPKENITCDFTATSFDLKVHGLNGQNLRLRRENLYKEIDPAGSTYRVKKNRITIVLHKKSKDETWTTLVAKTTTKRASKEADLGRDPTAGIMDMMKNLYEEGDAEMKRTIAKAWEESRTKRGGMGDLGGL